MRKIDPHKSIKDVVMFDRASNVKLAGELLKIHYPKISVMRGVEQNVTEHKDSLWNKSSV